MEDKIIKTIHQYSLKLPEETIGQLYAIAQDYAAVKNYVYRRFSGIGSLLKLYPGYEIQNEMTKSGLRGRLMMPSIYFYLSVFEALADIKTGWKLLRGKICDKAVHNDNFSEAEQRYIVRVLKNDVWFGNIVNRVNLELPEDLEEIRKKNAGLDNYIRRQVRKYKPDYQTRQQENFQISPKGYTYVEGGVEFASKIPRKRIFIPLTDHNRYKKQLKVVLKEDYLVIHAPVKTRVRKHEDYKGEIGVAIGYDTMLTTSNGHYYGEEYGRRQSVKNAQLMETDAGRRRMRSLYHYYKEIGKEQKADAILKNNLGKKKYNNRRSSADHEIKAYINAEINRMLQTEKPAVIYLQKLAWGNQNELPKYVKVRLSKWQKGYIRDRIIYKCKTEGIHLQEVYVTNGTCCSRCGEPGVRDARGFFCQACQRNVRVGVNTAENVLKQGREIMHTVSG